MRRTFDLELIQQLTDAVVFDTEAKQVIIESDRRRMANELFRKDNPPPYEALNAWVNLLILVAVSGTLLYWLFSVLFGKTAPLWCYLGIFTGLIYFMYVRWPEGPPLPFASGILSDRARESLLQNTERAAKSNLHVLTKLDKSAGFILFLRGFDAEFAQDWREESARDYLRDEPYRIKEYAPNAEVRLLKMLLDRTKIPAVINVLVQIPELGSGSPSINCETLYLPLRTWLACVQGLALHAKAVIFVISSRPSKGIKEELSALRHGSAPVMAVCECGLQALYTGLLPDNLLEVTQTEFKYQNSDPPTSPVPYEITSSVTESELQEYHRRLALLLAESARKD